MSATVHPYRRITGRRLLWIPQVLLAVAIAGGGLAKLFGDPAMVAMFNDIGAGQWFRYAVGALELAGGIGLLIPRLAALAAVCLAVLLAGAAITNVTVLDANPFMPIGFLAVAAFIGWFRRRDLAFRRAGSR